MDSNALARAESRISGLEFEIRRIRFESERLRSDIRRMEHAENSRLRLLDDFLVPMMWMAACGILGAGLGTIIGTAIKMNLA
jgi:hypothetical protein